VSGPNPFANAAVCLASSRLSGTTYPYLTGVQSPNTPIAWYQDYMSWIKSEVINGHQVTIGVLIKYGTDPQYDHEVSVTAIGTKNGGTTDSTYDSGDVLYFDDHGAYTVVGKNLSKGNPAIPYGAAPIPAAARPINSAIHLARFRRPERGPVRVRRKPTRSLSRARPQIRLRVAMAISALKRSLGTITDFRFLARSTIRVSFSPFVLQLNL